MSVVLDAGALLAVDRRDRRVGALLRAAQRAGLPLRTSAAAVAQVWRDGARQANLARLLAAVDARPLDVATGRRIGALLARSGTRDVVDGHLALVAVPGGSVLTSDPDDLRHLVEIAAIDARVVHV